MKDLKLFATAAWPLHASGLRQLIVCPWKVAMKYLSEPEEESGQPADTGSAVHEAARSFHKGKEPAACLADMGSGIAKYPKADLADAADMFLKYAADSRNREAEVVAVEEPVAFSIAPAPEDKTQAQIEVVGTLDQVRRINGQLYLYDIKTSKKEPMELLNQHTFQIAAYCVGAAVKFGAPVHPGALILPRRYKDRDPSSAPVFFHYPWKFQDTEHILSAIRYQVALVRAGILYHVPNADCSWCHAKSPDLCLPKLKEVKLVHLNGS